MGRATRRDRRRTETVRDFNPRPPWGGRRYHGQIAFAAIQAISIHALRGEGDVKKVVLPEPGKPFQSTPSVGRATARLDRESAQEKHFNPRPPWGGRPYIRLLHLTMTTFQSTPSVGRATFLKPCKCVKFRDISIHALRGEGDLCRCDIERCHKHFNPRPPWGGRLKEPLSQLS